MGGGNGGGRNDASWGGGNVVEGGATAGKLLDTVFDDFPPPVIGRPLVCSIIVGSNLGGMVAIAGDSPPLPTTSVVAGKVVAFFSSSSISFIRFIRVRLWSVLFMLAEVGVLPDWWHTVFSIPLQVATDVAKLVLPAVATASDLVAIARPRF
jgi:hypothetical protein